jgi:hypothetical protein
VKIFAVLAGIEIQIDLQDEAEPRRAKSRSAVVALRSNGLVPEAERARGWNFQTSPLRQTEIHSITTR